MDPKILISDIASIRECSVQNIHKLIKEKNISSKKQSQRVYLNGENAKKIIDREVPKKTIAIQTAKGGVGKTTIALSLGIRFWLFGAKVLFLDIDQQGNLSKTLGCSQPKFVLQDILEKNCSPEESHIEIKEGLGLIPSSLKNALLNQYMMAYGVREEKAIKNILKKFETLYDIIIIDCPPAVGSAVTSATIASDLVIAPLDPDDYAVDGMRLCFQEVSKLKEEYNLKTEFKILLNKYDARTLLSSSIVSELIENDLYKDCLFQSIIGISQEFPKSKSNKETIFDTTRQGKACKDIDLLTREILNWPTPEDMG